VPDLQEPESQDAYVVFDNADTPEPDLDAPLIEHRYERTVPKVTGAPWDMAAWIREDRARREAAGAFDAGGHTEIVQRAYLVEPDDLPRAPKPIAKRLIGLDWEVKCGVAIVYVTPTLYVGATETHSKGDLRYPDRDEWWWSIRAVLRTQGKPVAAFIASWCTVEAVGKKTATAFKDANTWDLVLHTTYVDKAGEFADWLAIFAPDADS
jgi:hypothetical protein